MKAIPFRNINSRHIFIAVLRADKINGYQREVFLPEQIGNSYKTVWESGNIIYGFSDDENIIDVVDIDGDGINEIAIVEESWGTAMGSKILTVYSISKGETSTITEDYCFVSAGKPSTPEITIQTSHDQEFKDKIEKYAVKRGFLEEITLYDLNEPEYAEQRWHLENGYIEDEDIEFHFYEGKPNS